MDRRTFVCGATLAALAAPRLARAAHLGAGRAPRVGVLGEVNPVGWTLRTAAAEIECRWAGDRPDRLRALAAELVDHRVDVLVAAGEAAARAAAGATHTVPIAFVAAGNPWAGGIRPDNVTGLIVPGEHAIAAERLAVIARVAPALRTVVALANPETPTTAPALHALRAAGRRRGVDVRVHTARSAEEAERSLGALDAPAPSGLVVLPDAGFAIGAQGLAAVAARRGWPAVYPARSFVEAGGLLAVSADTSRVLVRAAGLVSMLLAGTRPSVLSVEAEPGLDLAVNAGAARALGLSIPRSLVARAGVVGGA